MLKLKPASNKVYFHSVGEKDNFDVSLEGFIYNLAYSHNLSLSLFSHPVLTPKIHLKNFLYLGVSHSYIQWKLILQSFNILMQIRDICCRFFRLSEKAVNLQIEYSMETVRLLEAFRLWRRNELNITLQFKFFLMLQGKLFKIDLITSKCMAF